METKQTEVKQNGAKKPAPKKGKNPFRSNKFKRGGMATLMTVVFVAIVIVLNVVVSALAERFPESEKALKAAFRSLEKATIRNRTPREEIRTDRRTPPPLRPPRPRSPPPPPSCAPSPRAP